MEAYDFGSQETHLRFQISWKNLKAVYIFSRNEDVMQQNNSKLLRLNKLIFLIRAINAPNSAASLNAEDFWGLENSINRSIFFLLYTSTPLLL